MLRPAAAALRGGPPRAQREDVAIPGVLSCRPDLASPVPHVRVVARNGTSTLRRGLVTGVRALRVRGFLSLTARAKKARRAYRLELPYAN